MFLCPKAVNLGLSSREKMLEGSSLRRARFYLLNSPGLLVRSKTRLHLDLGPVNMLSRLKVVLDVSLPEQLAAVRADLAKDGIFPFLLAVELDLLVTLCDRQDLDRALVFTANLRSSFSGFFD